MATGTTSEGEGSRLFGPPQIHFPEDEGGHPEMLTEWWYGNFALTDSKGREYGAMVTYGSPGGIRILSISDLEANRFYHEASFSTTDYAGGLLDLRWGSNDHWFRTDPDSLSYRLDSYGTDIGLNLDLNSEKPPLMVGGDGFIEWPFGNSYYYSITRFRIRGQIRLSGKEIDVEGIGWMDHQWMNFVPAMVERSYEWLSVQLDNDTEIVLWQVINPDESIESRHLTMMLPDNSVYHTLDLALEKMDTWVSPETGREYGIQWRVREEAHDLDLVIKARYPEQEIQMFEDLGFTHAIWEGRTTISGHLAGEAVSGTGYAELIHPPRGVPEDLSPP